MSNGEIMIWAAAFVAARNKGLETYPRFDTRGMDHAEYRRLRKEYEDGVDASAAEAAHYAVESAREVLPRVREGWGEDSDVAESLLAVLRGT